MDPAGESSWLTMLLVDAVERASFLGDLLSGMARKGVGVILKMTKSPGSWRLGCRPGVAL